MSIHKSKGLEFPIVFIGGCSKHYNKDKSTGGMLLHMKTGISINVTDPILRCRYQSPMQRITSLMLDSENSAEELRLLYVAMTRARERLFAVCSFKEGKSFTNSVFKNISCHDVLLANSYTSLLELSVGDKWQIKRFSEEAAPSDNTPLPPKELVFRENKDISEKLSYVYPFKNLLKLPSKASVSFMKSAEINLLPEGDGSLHALNDISQKSVKLQKVSYEKKSSGAFFGTAHHKMLEHLRFDGTSAAHQKAELYARKILTEDEMKIIDDSKIDKFLSSDIAVKMADAVFIRREAPFVIDIGADEINDYLLPDERICIQGVIDCYFETRDGKIVLLDYKTDTYDDPEEIARRYSKQIYYYEKALKLKFNDKIIQKYLYLLHKNDIIEL